MDQWLRLHASTAGGSGFEEEKQGKTKWAAGGGGYCHGPLEAPRVYTSSSKLKLQKSLCTRVLDQICLLKRLMQPGSSNGRAKGGECQDC